jgi:RNA recognition motif-containing protein
MNNNKLFVGSLSYNVTDDQLQQLFSTVGTVVSAKVIIDRETNRSKGFGFVEMSNPDEAKKALDLTGQELDGRPIAVKIATPQVPR